jgi:hypothetical protein
MTLRLFGMTWSDLRKYAFCERDFGLGVVVFGSVFVSAYFDESLRRLHLLDVAAVLGIAILAVVIAAISILTAFLTEDYGRLLRETFGGNLREVFFPYQVIALASSATTFLAIVGIFVWPSSPGWARALSLAVSLGFAAWSVVGTFELVGITAAHGRMRLRLPELREAYDQGRRERRAG